MNNSLLFYFKIPLSILTIFPYFLSAQNVAIFKTYNAYAATSAIGEFNNGANFLINNCTPTGEASYMWTDAQGNLLNTENDFVGSCGRYRYDSIYYILTGSVGTEPNRTIVLSKKTRNNVALWIKTYSLGQDNFGQFVLPTHDGGFMVVGAAKVANDTSYKVQLLKTDALGNFQWQKVVNQGLFYSPIRRPDGGDCSDLVSNKVIPMHKIWQTTDGGYYFEYKTQLRPADCTTDNGDGAVVVRLDADGNYLWHKADLGTERQRKYHNIFPAENGHLLVLQTYASKDTFCTKQGYKLSKIDPLGNVLWTFERDGQTCTEPQYAGAVISTRAGNVYLETQKGRIVRRISGSTGQQLDSILVKNEAALTEATNMVETVNDGFAMTGGVGNVVYFYKNKFPPLDPCSNDTTAPIVTCPLSITVNLPMGQDSMVVDLPIPLLKDSCDHITLIATLPTQENIHYDTKLALGTTLVTWTAYDIARNSASCNFNVTLSRDVINAPDIALSMATDPQGYRVYTAINFIISAQNRANQDFTNVKVEFEHPPFTRNGGPAIASVGLWEEWCAGNIPCYTWTIPTLRANTTATLSVPLYILPILPPLVGTARLLSSMPIDTILPNNTATISVNPAPSIIETMPIIQKLAPNPTLDIVVLELDMAVEGEVQILLSGAFGQTLETQTRHVKQGINQLSFDVRQQPKGIYFVAVSTHIGLSTPRKFVKMD